MQTKRALPAEMSPETIKEIKKIMGENVEGVTDIFGTLSDAIRLRILRALEIEDLCVCVLVEIAGCRYSALSYHLKLLKEIRLIKSTREGNFLIYGLTDKGKDILECVHKYFE